MPDYSNGPLLIEQLAAGKFEVCISTLNRDCRAVVEDMVRRQILGSSIHFHEITNLHLASLRCSLDAMLATVQEIISSRSAPPKSIRKKIYNSAENAAKGMVTRLKQERDDRVKACAYNWQSSDPFEKTAEIYVAEFFGKLTVMLDAAEHQTKGSNLKHPLVVGCFRGCSGHHGLQI